MKSTQYVGFLLAASVASVLVWLCHVASVVAQPTVQLQTHPPLNQVIPATEPVQLTLHATNGAQQPIANAVFQIRLLTPAKTPWFTSDFPIVEGTTLLEMEAIAPSGQLTLAQTLPIRGVYHLEVNVAPQTADAFVPFSQVLTFSVPENPVKYRNVAILAVILLLAGLGSGWVLGGEQRVHDGELAPQPVRMLLSAAIVVAIAVLLTINISAERAAVQTHHHGEGLASAPASLTAQGFHLQLTGERHATVGQTALQTVQITDAATKRPVTDVVVTLQVVDLEHDQPVFNFEGIPDSTGQISWSPQFFDGAPHQVTATLSPLPASNGFASSTENRSFSPIQVSHRVDVDGVVPPLYIRFISLMYFTSLYAVGLLLGLLIHRRRHRPDWRSQKI